MGLSYLELRLRVKGLRFRVGGFIRFDALERGLGLVGLMIQAH